MAPVDKSVAKLKHQMEENKFHPFRLQIDGTLKLTVRSSAFWPAIALLFASAISSIYLIVAADFAHPLFLLPHIGVLVSSIAILALRHQDTITLFPMNKEYEVSRGKSIIRSKFHNIFIRLQIKTLRDEKKMYHLVFGGYLVDTFRLTSPYRREGELRKLGQEIASNLGLNYFDKTNTSRHHKCIHIRPEKQVFSFDYDYKKSRNSSVKQSIDMMGAMDSNNVLATAEVAEDCDVDDFDEGLMPDEGVNAILAQMQREDVEGLLIAK